MREEVWHLSRPAKHIWKWFRGRLPPPAQRQDSQLLGAGVEETSNRSKVNANKRGGVGEEYKLENVTLALGLSSPLGFPMGS